MGGASCPAPNREISWAISIRLESQNYKCPREQTAAVTITIYSWDPQGKNGAARRGNLSAGAGSVVSASFNFIRLILLIPVTPWLFCST